MRFLPELRERYVGPASFYKQALAIARYREKGGRFCRPERSNPDSPEIRS